MSNVIRYFVVGFMMSVLYTMAYSQAGDDSLKRSRASPAPESGS